MKTIKNIYFSCALLLCSIISFAQDLPTRPSPPKLVNDFTNTLTADQVQTLEQKLVALDNATSTQIAIVILPSTNGRTIADYNVELLRKWGVGSKKNNNGIILLVAKNDRKLDITVGYGLEGSLTDATAKSIIDDVIVPSFKGDDYYKGISDGTDAIVQAVQGKYNDKRTHTSEDGGGTFIIFIIIFFIIIIFISRKGGGNSGTYMSRRGQRGIADAIFWNTILNGGVGSGGGGWSGGDSGGGGFGGFGGGSGGGGGASGSW
jgi:uncharacterized protein